MRDMLSELKQQNQVLHEVLRAHTPRGVSASIDESLNSLSSYESSLTASSIAEPPYAPRHSAQFESMYDSSEKACSTAEPPYAPRHSAHYESVYRRPANAQSSSGYPCVPRTTLLDYDTRQGLESMRSIHAKAFDRSGPPPVNKPAYLTPVGSFSENLDRTSMSSSFSDVSVSQTSCASETTYASSREAILAAARDRPFFLPKHMLNSIESPRPLSSSRSASSGSCSSDEGSKSKGYSSVYVKGRKRSKARSNKPEPGTSNTWEKAYKEYRGFCGWNK